MNSPLRSRQSMRKRRKCSQNHEVYQTKAIKIIIKIKILLRKISKRKSNLNEERQLWNFSLSRLQILENLHKRGIFNDIMNNLQDSVLIAAMESYLNVKPFRKIAQKMASVLKKLDFFAKQIKIDKFMSLEKYIGPVFNQKANFSTTKKNFVNLFPIHGQENWHHERSYDVLNNYRIEENLFLVKENVILSARRHQFTTHLNRDSSKKLIRINKLDLCSPDISVFLNCESKLNSKNQEMALFSIIEMKFINPNKRAHLLELCAQILKNVLHCSAKRQYFPKHASIDIRSVNQISYPFFCREKCIFDDISIAIIFNPVQILNILTQFVFQNGIHSKHGEENKPYLVINIQHINHLQNSPSYKNTLEFFIRNTYERELNNFQISSIPDYLAPKLFYAHSEIFPLSPIYFLNSESRVEDLTEREFLIILITFLDELDEKINEIMLLYEKICPSDTSLNSLTGNKETNVETGEHFTLSKARKSSFKSAKSRFFDASGNKNVLNSYIIVNTNHDQIYRSFEGQNAGPIKIDREISYQEKYKELNEVRNSAQFSHISYEFFKYARIVEFDMSDPHGPDALKKYIYLIQNIRKIYQFSNSKKQNDVKTSKRIKNHVKNAHCTHNFVNYYLRNDEKNRNTILFSRFETDQKVYNANSGKNIQIRHMIIFDLKFSPCKTNFSKGCDGNNSLITERKSDKTVYETDKGCCHDEEFYVYTCNECLERYFKDFRNILSYIRNQKNKIVRGVLNTHRPEIHNNLLKIFLIFIFFDLTRITRISSELSRISAPQQILSVMRSLITAIDWIKQNEIKNHNLDFFCVFLRTIILKSIGFKISWRTEPIRGKNNEKCLAYFRIKIIPQDQSYSDKKVRDKILMIYSNEDTGIYHGFSKKVTKIHLCKKLFDRSFRLVEELDSNRGLCGNPLLTLNKVIERITACFDVHDLNKP